MLWVNCQSDTRNQTTLISCLLKLFAIEKKSRHFFSRQFNILTYFQSMDIAFFDTNSGQSKYWESRRSMQIFFFSVSGSTRRPQKFKATKGSKIIEYSISSWNLTEFRQSKLLDETKKMTEIAIDSFIRSFLSMIN